MWDRLLPRCAKKRASRGLFRCATADVPRSLGALRSSARRRRFRKCWTRSGRCCRAPRALAWCLGPKVPRAFCGVERFEALRASHSVCFVVSLSFARDA
eukprot:scaffold1540_cov181-Pinguiococcus_pyrenoidosus.AAC.3